MRLAMKKKLLTVLSCGRMKFWNGIPIKQFMCREINIFSSIYPAIMEWNPYTSYLFVFLAKKINQFIPTLPWKFSKRTKINPRIFTHIFQNAPKMSWRLLRGLYNIFWCILKRCEKKRFIMVFQNLGVW